MEPSKVAVVVGEVESEPVYWEFDQEIYYLLAPLLGKKIHQNVKEKPSMIGKQKNTNKQFFNSSQKVNSSHAMVLKSTV